MSTIFGLYDNTDPVLRETSIRAMQSAMDHWYPDSKGLMQDGPVAMGHLLLHNTPESLYEIQPFRLGTSWITADARIDNRDDVLAQLKDPPTEGTQAPDAVLILHLYREIGKDAIAELKGDFALAIWDQQRGQLICARDPIGVKNLFFAKMREGFAFASEIRGILALPNIDRAVDEVFVDCLLTDEDPSGVQTFYKFINRLLPGHLLVYCGQHPVIQRYWIPQLPSLLKLTSKTEYLEAFRESFRKAVRQRLRTVFPVSAELSGGLDSSAVTCVAASLIDDPGRLFTFSNVLTSSGSGDKPYRDEEEFIDCVIRHCGIQQSVKVSESGRAYPLAYHDLELEVNSGVDVYSAYWQEPLRKEMSARNIRVSLSGFGGDEAITDRSRWYFKDYLREGRYFRFLLSAFRGGHYTVPGKIALKAISPGIVHLLKDQKLRKPMRRSYLRKDLPRPQPQVTVMASATGGLEGYKGYLLNKIIRDYTWQRIQSEGLFGIRHRLEPRYPLVDLDLLHLFLSMPLDLIGHPRQDRYLFREAMRGILPEEIRLRSDKLVSAGIYYLKEARENAPFFLEWLQERRKQLKTERSARIDINAMILGWDPKKPQNHKQGHFTPSGSFRAECLLRMEELVERQHFTLIE